MGCPGCQRDPIPRQIPARRDQAQARCRSPPVLRERGGSYIHHQRFSCQCDARRATAGRGCDSGSWERWPGSQPSVRKQRAASQGASFPVPSPPAQSTPPHAGITEPRALRRDAAPAGSPRGEAGGCQPTPPAGLSPPLGQPLSSAPPTAPNSFQDVESLPFGKIWLPNAAPAAQGLLFPMDFISTRMLQLLPGSPPSPQRLCGGSSVTPGPFNTCEKVLWGAQRGWERPWGPLGRRDGKGWMQGWGSEGQTTSFLGQPPKCSGLGALSSAAPTHTEQEVWITPGLMWHRENSFSPHAAPRPQPSQSQRSSQQDKSQCRGWERRQHKGTRGNLAVTPSDPPPAWKRSRICPIGTPQHKQHYPGFATSHANPLPSREEAHLSQEIN